MRSHTFLSSEGKDASETEWVPIGLYNLLSFFNFWSFISFHFTHTTTSTSHLYKIHHIYVENFRIWSRDETSDGKEKIKYLQ